MSERLPLLRGYFYTDLTLGFTDASSAQKDPESWGTWICCGRKLSLVHMQAPLKAGARITLRPQASLVMEVWKILFLNVVPAV